jgi:hypothetical protein
MNKYIVHYVILGNVAVEAEDRRGAEEKVFEFAQDVAGAVKTEIRVQPMEFLP